MVELCWYTTFAPVLIQIWIYQGLEPSLLNKPKHPWSIKLHCESWTSANILLSLIKYHTTNNCLDAMKTIHHARSVWKRRTVAFWRNINVPTQIIIFAAYIFTGMAVNSNPCTCSCLHFIKIFIHRKRCEREERSFCKERSGWLIIHLLHRDKMQTFCHLFLYITPTH